VLDAGVGHKGKFVDAVYSVFKLGGIPTATTVTEEFTELIQSWLEKAGSYPYIKFVDVKRKQTTRMVKLYCPDEECTGATKKSVEQGQGTIFRLSSAVVDKNDEFFCPICMGPAYVDSPVRTDIYV